VEGNQHHRWAQFVGEHYPGAIGFARSLARDRDRADDLVQEAFARLMAGPPGVRDQRAYLNTIIVNLARAEWRQERRPYAAPMLVETVADDVDLRLDVGQAVRSLPQAQRDVIWLRYYAGLPVQEIATLLRHPEGSVKSLLHHARRRLAYLLHPRR
jgi:RNA polymerase sigma-70 factor, ECF subfamily